MTVALKIYGHYYEIGAPHKPLPSLLPSQVTFSKKLENINFNHPLGKK